MVKQDLEEGQIVLCEVQKILGTTVFCKIEGNGEGTLITSEISPGRIRNLRAYVFPGKKVVCKILRIKENQIHLSLRRVKQNERKELLDKIKKEKNYKAILKTVLGKPESEEIINKITKTQDLISFFEEIKKDPKILEKYMKKTETEKIIKILESKKEKDKEVKQIINLSSKAENGIIIVKDLIKKINQKNKSKIIYLAAGKYKITLTGPDFKNLKTQINEILKEIEKQAKKQGCEFELEKTKH
jgi:translation initiation factor 2 alpha subunit (eIF-2alpha)